MKSYQYKVLENILFPINWTIGKYLQRLCQTSPRHFQKTYDYFANNGFLPVKFHYYQPIVKREMLPSNYLELETPLIGVDLQIEQQLQLLKEFQYHDELLAIHDKKINDIEPYYDNGSFHYGDSEIWYSLIRYFKPKKIIEIGSGNSTKFARKALLKNKSEGYESEHLCIEPYEFPYLDDLGVTVVRERVENIDESTLSDLEENDILFVDSSHVVRTQGDVVHIFLEMLPKLSAGVIIHVHDIFLPREYPWLWINNYRYFWNEQYLLQALLCFSSKFRTLLSLNYLRHHYEHELYAVCPLLGSAPYREPASYYLKVAPPP